MKKLQVIMELKSPVLPGSGEGLGSLIDADIIYDNYGLPYFPARRFKGLLRESAVEVKEMLELASIQYLLGVGVDDVFGSIGSQKEAPAVFRNLFLTDYSNIVDWLKWAFEEPESIVSKDTVLDTFTEIRQQTAISLQNGTAEENSLRTVRVLKAGYTFTGGVEFNIADDKLYGLLALACANLKYIGSNRTRGLGEVVCSLWDGQANLTQEILEDLKGANCLVQPRL